MQDLAGNILVGFQGYVVLGIPKYLTLATTIEKGGDSPLKCSIWQLSQHVSLQFKLFAQTPQCMEISKGKVLEMHIVR